MRALSGLLPKPKRVRLLQGETELTSGVAIALTRYPTEEELVVAKWLEGELKQRFGIRTRRVHGELEMSDGRFIRLELLGRPGALKPQGFLPPFGEWYAIRSDRRGILLTGGAPEGLRNAGQTLLQLCRNDATARVSLPRLLLEDKPALAFRGVHLDVSRDKVPTLFTLKEFTRKLAAWKYNKFILYVEHSFRFAGHPSIGSGEARLTAAEIRSLDEHCRRLGIELIPSLASFAHMGRILRRPEFRHLSTGGPEPDILMPLAEASYDFLDALYQEYLPCFASNYFSVNCDETEALVRGRSAKLVKRLGMGELYLRHIFRLHQLVSGKHRRRMMIWGDILARHPEIIPRLPRDIVILPWGYWHRWSGRAVRPLVQAGLEVALCPGTNSWHALSPWVPVANVNIISAARAAQESRALGLLVTDWGDGGHQQPLGLSEHAFALGAEAAWNAGRTPILQEERIFCENVFGEGRLTAARLWRALGEANAALAINTGGWDPPNQKSIHIDSWYTINFFLFFLEHSLEGRWFSQVRPSGVRSLARLAAIARRCLDELEARAKGPVLLRRELSYSVGQLEHLAKRLTWMLELKRAKQRRSDLMRHAEWLVRDIRRLSKEFSELWRTRNKPLGQKTTLRLYSQAERFYLGELRRLRA